jgi:hypothetical protein
MEWEKMICALNFKADTHVVRHINFGIGMGHTYFARLSALSDFPIYTKVYVVNSGEYADLALRPDACHQSIDHLHTKSINHEARTANLLVIDLSNNSMVEHSDFVKEKISSIPTHSSVLVLHAKI